MASDSSVRKWVSLLVLSLALAIIIIDGTVLNVSMKYLVRDLHTDLQGIQWVITSYSLVLAALTITGGRLGDILGRKRMFITGAILFAIGSLIASLSTDVNTLLLGWSLIEGIGAALMMPATASLIMSIFQGSERAIAFGIWGGVAGAASAFGPLLGGYLTTNYSWHWAFRINVGMVALLLIGSTVIREVKEPKEHKSLDVIGVFISALGLSTMVYGFIKSSTYGWWQPRQAFEIFGASVTPFGISAVPFLILAGLVILYGFIRWELAVERRGATPLVSMKIFHNKQFTAGLITLIILVLGQSGMIFALPVFLQSVKGLDAFNTGVGILPMALAVLFTAPIAGGLTRVIAPKRLIQVGLVIEVIAVGILYSILRVDVSTWQLAPGLLIYGIGMGLVMAQITNLTLSAVDVKIAGEASGLNNTSRQLGATLGLAIIGSIFLSVFTSRMTDGINASTVVPSPMKAAIIRQIEANSSSYEFGGGDQSSSGSGVPEIGAEMVRIKNEAMTAGNKVSFIFTGIFIAMCLLASFNLPNTRYHKPKGMAGH
jgi:EmrB/QacA subfamily drug resistance transporter